MDPSSGSDDGTHLTPLDLPQDYWIVLALPLGATKESTAAVYGSFDDRAGADGWEQRSAAAASRARRRQEAPGPRSASAERPRVISARG